MAIFRKIHVSFWSDTFVQSLTPEQKFFFLYLLTNERTKQCGIYETSTRQMSYDTGYNIETINKLLTFFQKAGKTVFSTSTSEIAIKNWEKYNGSRSPDIKALVNKELSAVKEKKLIEWLQSDNRVYPQSESSLRGEPEPERDKEQEGEPEQEEESYSLKISAAANEAWKNKIWKEGVVKGLKLQQQQLKRWMGLFNGSLVAKPIDDLTPKRYMAACRGWIQKRIDAGNKLPDDERSNAPPLTTIIHKSKNEDE